jgi:hypothetical protein
VFEIKYLNDVYVKQRNTPPVLFANSQYQDIVSTCGKGNHGRRCSSAAVNLTKIFDITCTENGFPPLVFKMNTNDPTFLCRTLTEIPVVGQPFNDSGWHFYNLLNGGVQLPEANSTNVINIVLPLVNRRSKDFFARGSGRCNFEERMDAKSKFTNSDGIVSSI